MAGRKKSDTDMVGRDEIVIIRRDPNSGWLPGFLLGAAVGAVAGLLRAPKSGLHTRRTITHRLQSTREAATNKLPGRSGSASA